MPRINVREKIQIHAVHGCNSHMAEGLGPCWLHTHGMEAFNLPNLEIKAVPVFLAGRAAEIINHIADYMINTKPVKVGERMNLGDGIIVQLVKGTGDGEDADYCSNLLEIVDFKAPCAVCDAKGN